MLCPRVRVRPQALKRLPVDGGCAKVTAPYEEWHASSGRANGKRNSWTSARRTAIRCGPHPRPKARSDDLASSRHATPTCQPAFRRPATQARDYKLLLRPKYHRYRARGGAGAASRVGMDSLGGRRRHFTRSARMLPRCRPDVPSPGYVRTSRSVVHAPLSVFHPEEATESVVGDVARPAVRVQSRTFGIDGVGTPADEQIVLGADSGAWLSIAVTCIVILLVEVRRLPPWLDVTRCWWTRNHVSGRDSRDDNSRWDPAWLPFS